PDRRQGDGRIDDHPGASSCRCGRPASVAARDHPRARGESTADDERQAPSLPVPRRVPGRHAEPHRRVARATERRAHRVMPSLETTIPAVATRYLRAGSPELTGLDSLAAIELTAALEEALQCEVPIDLLIDCPDPHTLAARLAEHRTTAMSQP